MGTRYYDRQGRPIDLEEWAELFSDHDYKRVALDVVGASTVSTVWLGANHNWGQGAPLIFETMIFGGPMDGFQDRYTTEAEAVDGHADVMAQLLRADFEALH